MRLIEAARLVRNVIPDWSYSKVKEAVLPAAVRLRPNLPRTATFLLKHRLALTAIAFIDVRRSITGVYGELDVNHPLTLPNLPLGFDPTEPQLTSGIAHFLRANGDLNLAKKRTRSFLQALLKGASNGRAYSSAIAAIEKAIHLDVASEFALRNGKRIDLILKWILPGGAAFVVVIEAKFGHKVTRNQLPAYRQYVKRLVNDEFRALVLITPSGDICKRNKDWTVLTWRVLLNRWERLQRASGDTDRNFMILRKMIWDKL